MNKQIRTLCRNLLTMTGTWKFASYLRRSGVVNTIRNTINRHNIFVNSKGKIVFPHLDIYITKSCNLRCEHCASFNPFRHGIIPKDDVIKMINQWSERISPQEVALLGGEPLLHPDYQEIVMTARNTWKQSVITVVTNGILLPKVQDEFLQQMADNAIEFIISRHINTENYNCNLNAAIHRFQKFGVKYEIIESHKSWVACHSLDTDGTPRSPNSNPAESWKHCLAKKCTTISGNQLCRCSIIINILQAVIEGSLPLAEFIDVAKHKFVTLDDSDEAILKYLRGGAMKECCFCLEDFESIEARQIPTEKLKLVKQIISERNREYNELQGFNLIQSEQTGDSDNSDTDQTNSPDIQNVG